MNSISVKDDIFKYLECIKDLEVSIYRVSTAYDKIRDQAEKYESQSFYEEKVKESAPIQEKMSFIEMLLIGIVIGVVGIIATFIVVAIIVLFKVCIQHELFFLDWLLGRADYFDGQFSICWKWARIVGLICFFICMLSAGAHNKEVKENNRKTIKETELRNETIDLENAERKKMALLAKQKAEIYKEELDILKGKYAEIKKLLEKYYDLDYIYPKYRKLVYICSIYEYFDSGRCDTLTGPYGAYNLLEQDIKYSKIVEKLDVIVDKLDEIIENQRELYSVMRDCTNSIAELANSLDNVGRNVNNIFEGIEEKLSDIEFNSNLTAQYSQYTAMYNFFKN